MQSIEIDVFPPSFLSGPASTSLTSPLVAHTKRGLSAAKNITSMYIEPLRKWLDDTYGDMDYALNAAKARRRRKRDRIGDAVSSLCGGLVRFPANDDPSYSSVSPASAQQPEINLLIDIKRAPSAVLPLLQSSLLPLRRHLTTYDQAGNVRRGRVRVVLSGDLTGVKGKLEEWMCGDFGGASSPPSVEDVPEPEVPMFRGGGAGGGRASRLWPGFEERGIFFIDGRVRDAGGEAAAAAADPINSDDKIPLVSFNYTWLRLSAWCQGKSRDVVVREICEEAHGRGKKVRVYGCPNTDKDWEKVSELGVDMISVDEHERFREFCRNRVEERRMKNVEALFCF